MQVLKLRSDFFPRQCAAEMAQIGVIKDTVQVIVGLTRLSMFLLGEQNLVYHLFVYL